MRANAVPQDDGDENAGGMPPPSWVWPGEEMSPAKF
jgi:hypothetical protein